MTRLSSLSALRRGLRADGEQLLWLRCQTPCHWPSTLAFLAARCIPGLETCVDGTYRRSVVFAGHHGVLSARPVRESWLQVRVRGLPAHALPGLIARLRRVFDLDAQPALIAAALARDPLMARLLQARPGLRVPQGWEACEQAMRTVLGQQISVAGAMTLAGRLVARHGQALGLDAAPLMHVFPQAAVLAEAELQGLGMPRARAATLSTLARALLEQPDLLRPGQPLAQALTRLCGLKGIGPWSAQYLALRQLGAGDALPLGDVALVKALRLLEGPEVQLAERSLAWRPWRAYAAQHLWASLADLSPTGASSPR
ncbi:MAG: DNA-3-methyladenine glycosylase 2 family protein [Paucimonas sp.]|uniref:DNA-3-methyladenine glycosylase family protein n=1 Tax=Pantoea sp. Cy-639 TaxID=2608360 RepID=UPI00142347C9|nr:AlkA N-terminal domain-containing protein [Pantoea sp. Cy-639]MDR2307907.1 DNA-3-methyladenine glycosylase 2 family protein [Paucimonas sp.]NIF18734.1 DNA-3-methyladenine glycosylase 2 family protein [Pantoea sp. Cy-639]